MTFTERHFFPGANTPEGFVSRFDGILPTRESGRFFYCIKGGPGTGKSSFMRKLGDDLKASDQPVEYFHCSSDAASLDGIAFPKANIALADGTAPHILDPKYPAAADRIVDLGACWDEAGIAAHRDKIQRLCAQNSACFARAYRYLAAAKQLRLDAAAQAAPYVSPWAADRECVRIVYEEMGSYPAGHRRGALRRLFATGFTPGGHISFLDSILQGCTRVYHVLGGVGSPTGELMAKVQETALARGIDVESFTCLMDPFGPPEHLVLPALGVALVTVNSAHSTASAAQVTVDLDTYVSLPDSARDIQRFDEEQAHALVLAALDALRQAKVIHDELETCYVPHMDFDKVEALRQDILAEIRNRAQLATNSAK
ncbi:MAG: hypothetical protein PHD32_12260 [Eubacteriales bacterium]|nr:hypothetical protein [Eubacteriales bacterium]